MKKVVACCFAFALLVSGITFAGEQKGVTVEITSFPPGKELKPGVAVLMEVQGLTAAEEKIVKWKYNKVEGDVVLSFGKYRMFAGTEPGVRTFIVQIPVNGEDPIFVAQFKYGGEKDTPDPSPEPGPVPFVELYVLVVEPVKRTQNQALVILDMSWRKLLENGGHKWRITTPKTNAKDLKPWVERCKGKQLPHVLLISDAAELVAEFPLPTSGEEFARKLEEIIKVTE